MYRNYNSKFKNNVVNIIVGEYYATKKEEIISTLLGSCVSVCLIDDINKVYGMNHFLLPGNLTSKELYIDNSARFGVHSMELLIGSMQKMGAERNAFKAKVFGGGKILNTKSEMITVNEDNIKFAHEFLEFERIPIISEDVGGSHGRRIYFDTKDGSVYIEKVKTNLVKGIEERQKPVKAQNDNLEIWE